MTFVSCFSTEGADANNPATVKFIVRSKIRFVILVAYTDSFKTLTTRECSFLSKLFFAVAVFTSSIVVSGEAEGVLIVEAGTGFSLIGFHSPYRTFLEAA